MTRSDIQKSGLYLFLVGILCIEYLLNAKRLLGHYDLGWHLAAGDLIRAQGHVPAHDPWSYTAGAQEWFNISWLWDVLASALVQHAGLEGLTLLVVACGGAIAAYLAWMCRRAGASPLAACIAVFAGCLLYPSFATFPDIYLAASPNMFTMLFAVIFAGECLRKSRRMLVLPVIMLLWANLHGGFLIGLGILGFFAGIALLRRDWNALRLYVLTGCLCLAATFVNPLGWRLYAGVAATLGNFVQSHISEWWPYYRDIVLPGSLPNIFYIGLFVILEAALRTPAPLEARLLSWLFLFLGLYQFRYMAFFFLFSAVPMALHVEGVLTSRLREQSARALFLAGIAALLALPLVWLQMKPAIAMPPMLSQRDVRYLETHVPHARLLNHWNYGGLLIFHGRGRIPVFVDGRAATVYPESVLRDYFTVGQRQVNPSAWDALLAKYRIDTVLWLNTHGELRHFLVGQRGWKEIYTGQYASLYVKPADAAGETH